MPPSSGRLDSSKRQSRRPKPQRTHRPYPWPGVPIDSNDWVDAGVVKTQDNRRVSRTTAGNIRTSSSDAGPAAYPTITAAAITVVHKPFLLPTAVWVTFCVLTIWFDSL